MKLHILLLSAFLLLACSPSSQKSSKLRVISLAPSVTEYLYHIGLKDEVIGVTDHCIVPRDVDKKAISLGGMDPELELIIAKNPTIVFTVNDRPDVHKRLRAIGIKVVRVKSVTFEETLDSFTQIGKLLDKEEEAEQLISECRTSLKAAVGKFQESNQKVLLSIATLHDKPGKVAPWIAGSGNLYSFLLKQFKIKNAYDGEKSYLKLSTESLITSNPDIIFILTPYKLSAEKIKEELAAWKIVPEINAVKNQKIFFLGGDFMMLTGPRIPLIINEFEKALKAAQK